MNGLFRYACIRAIGITTTSPRPSPPGEGVDSPAAARHPLLEGEAFRTHEMGFIGPIRLIRLIIRHYESDEEWGLGFDGGHDAAGGMQTGEDGTGGGCAR